jgi:archaellum component FlaC
MNEKKYEKRLDFQQKIISRQSEQIEDLKLQNEKLRLELQKKDEFINSIASMREELTRHIEDVKGYKKQYKKLIDEIRNMKEILNQDVYKGRWKLIKFLLK